jgi:hypothetical protein
MALSPPTTITRGRILDRARSWLRPSVPYSQHHFHSNEYGTYRTDCSGYVSMAWALPGIPANRHGGLDTIGLAEVSAPIDGHELLAGDVLLCTEGTNLTRHVTVFRHWGDEHRNSYWGFEQAGGTGTVHRLIHYPYERRAELFRAVRYLGVVDDAELVDIGKESR